MINFLKYLNLSFNLIGNQSRVIDEDQNRCYRYKPPADRERNAGSCR